MPQSINQDFPYYGSNESSSSGSSPTFIEKCRFPTRRVYNSTRSNGAMCNGMINGNGSTSLSSSNSEHESEENFPSITCLKDYLPKDPPAPLAKPFQDEQKLAELLNRTKYPIVQRNGQRIYGGPPPDYNAPPPCKGTEVFVGKIPRDMYEWELVPIFERCGRIYEMRLMMDFSGSNRGYMFVRFFTKNEAKRAIKELNDLEVRPGKIIGVIPSVDNRKLWVSGIPKNRTSDEIRAEMSKLTDGVTSVYIYSHPIDKSKTRGYAFIEYESHRAAALARRKLVPGLGRNFLFDHEIERVDWAEPENEVDEEVMKKVKVLFIRNLTLQVTEDEIVSIFESASNGPVERVKKAKDFAFVHFATREQAETAYENTKNGLYVKGHLVEVNWSKPVDRQIHRERKQLTRVLTAGNHMLEPMPPIAPIPVVANPYGLLMNPVPRMVPPRSGGAAGIRGLGAPGTPPPKNLVRHLNRFVDQDTYQEMAMKCGKMFNNEFNPYQSGMIPQGPPTSPPPLNGNGNGLGGGGFFNPNMRMLPPQVPPMGYPHQPFLYYH